MPDDPHGGHPYGPIVPAGEPDRDLAEEKVWALHSDGKPASAPDLVASEDHLESWIKAAAGRSLAFQTVSAGRPNDVTLVPFHELFGKRYALYWHIYGEKEWAGVDARRRARPAEEAARRKAVEARLVDRVSVGEDESEKIHNLQAEKSESGELRGERWRHAVEGGWFSYDLKVLPDKPMVLLAKYWGAIRRTFDILIDGENRHPVG
jgi:hypothetical protein